MKNTFAKFIKDKRVAAGLSQIEVGKKLGMHSQIISNWERGRCFIPLKRMKLVAKIYKVEIHELYANYCDEVLRRDFEIVLRGK